MIKFTPENCHKTNRTTRNATRSQRYSAGFRRFDQPHQRGVKLNDIFASFDLLDRFREDPASVYTHMHDLVGKLYQRRIELHGQEQWMADVQAIRNHPHFAILREDPFTQRAILKPRGYAGDAVMMDFIYSLEDKQESPIASSIGNSIFKYTSSASSSSGVRARREQIAISLNEVLSADSNRSVLAVASGHLREAELSSAVRRKRFSRLVALDADEESLSEVERAYGRFGVTTFHANIARLITGRLSIGTFDLIYSTGLYDYLNQRTGSALTKQLFAMLNPGGKLIIANFLPEIRDVGYMEACMEWFLIYRDRFEMVKLLSGLPSHELGMTRIWTEENQNVIFLEVERAKTTNVQNRAI